MKKVVYIFIFYILVINCVAEAPFYVTGEVSYFDELVEQEKTDVWDDDNLEFFTSFVFGLEYKILFAEAEFNTFMIKAESFMFQPYTQEYKARIGIKYEFIKIQLEHLCAHSIDGLVDNYGHDKISIMFDSRGY